MTPPLDRTGESNARVAVGIAIVVYATVLLGRVVGNLDLDRDNVRDATAARNTVDDLRSNE